MPESRKEVVKLRRFREEFRENFRQIFPAFAVYLNDRH
jgi:hypothetical protein